MPPEGLLGRGLAEDIGGVAVVSRWSLKAWAWAGVETRQRSRLGCLLVKVCDDVDLAGAATGGQGDQKGGDPGSPVLETLTKEIVRETSGWVGQERREGS